MRNRDIVFILLMTFWLCIAIFTLICNVFGFSESLGINIGAIVYFVLYLVIEKNSPNFKNWSNFKL